MYIDINTLFTFEVSKSDDQSILAAIVLWRTKNFERSNFGISKNVIVSCPLLLL
jgi:hypothetical protein